MARHRLTRHSDDEGPVPTAFCVCGHWESDHADDSPRGRVLRRQDVYCVGRVGPERCTCGGYRESWRSAERRTRWAQYRSTGGAW